jgi:hypothetical protein
MKKINPLSKHCCCNYIIIAFAICLISPSFATEKNTKNICAQWAAKRDGSFFQDFKKISKKFDLALEMQELWVGQLKQFDDENAEIWLNIQAITDVFLVGANTTGETLKLVMGVSAVSYTGQALINNLDKIIDAKDIITSENIDQAAFRYISQQGNSVGYSLKTLTIIKDLIDAKARFKDRHSTIKSVKRTVKKLRKNIVRARKQLDRSQKKLIDISEFKNKMDGVCNRVVKDARDCIKVTAELDYDKRKTYKFTNQCSREVYFFMCYEGKDSQHKKPCGKTSYYRHNSILKPGGTKFNYFISPANLSIEYGACYGGYRSGKLSSGKNYYCEAYA